MRHIFENFQVSCQMFIDNAKPLSHMALVIYKSSWCKQVVRMLPALSDRECLLTMLNIFHILHL